MRISMSIPNGITASYVYNDKGLLTSLTHLSSTGAVVASNSYTHDLVGNRTTNTNQARTASYSYDNVYRLTEAGYSTTGWSGEEKAAKKGSSGKAGGSNPYALEAQKDVFSYDPVGNRLSDRRTSIYSYNAGNQLTSEDGTTYTYDKNGNLVTKVTATESVSYSYDYENRLISVEKSDGTQVEFAYDPFGRRIEKAVTASSISTTTRYYYDSEDILFETDGAGVVGNKYTHGPGIDEPLALSNNKGNFYYHADGLGSIVALTDSTQEVVQDYQYYFFGDLKDEKNRIKQPYKYTAREWDGEIGLYFYRARYYDAEAGRFITKDPIGFRGGINLYAYVLNNPINHTDPYGLLHAGFVKQLIKMTDKQLEKTIKSLSRRIDEHKVMSPSAHHKHEIRVFSEQKELAEKEAKRRGLKGVGETGARAAAFCEYMSEEEADNRTDSWWFPWIDIFGASHAY